MPIAIRLNMGVSAQSHLSDSGVGTSSFNPFDLECQPAFTVLNRGLWLLLFPNVCPRTLDCGRRFTVLNTLAIASHMGEKGVSFPKECTRGDRALAEHES